MKTALQFATEARVSIAMLEESVRAGSRQKAVKICATLWERVSAMLTYIEEVERENVGLRMDLLCADQPGIEVEVEPNGTVHKRVNVVETIDIATGEVCRAKATKPKRRWTRRVGHSRSTEANESAMWRKAHVAFLSGRLVIGTTIGRRELCELIGISPNYIEELMLDLAEHRSPLKLVEDGKNLVVAHR